MDRQITDPKEVGRRLVKLRGIRTRVGVSRETGISLPSLTAYERGERTPRGPVKEKLASYYGVSVEEIFFARQNNG